MSIIGAAILDYGGSHVWQLPRQGVCELSIRAIGGGGPSSSSSVHADNNDNNRQQHGMVTQIIRFASRLVGLKKRPHRGRFASSAQCKMKLVAFAAEFARR